MSFIFSCYVMVAATILYPLLASLPLWFKTKTLKEEKIIDRIGSTYELIQIDNLARAFYPLLFVLRRISLIYVIFMEIGIQLQYTILSNLLVMIYVGTVRPFVSNEINKRELINEAFIVFMTSLLPVFTDFV
jgi:hypothetical protein